MKKVLNGGASDHDAFACDFRVPGINTPVRVVTYNAAKNDALRVRAQFAAIHHLGPDVVELQEIKRKRGRRDPVLHWRRLGYKVVYARPEFALAWDPVEWDHVVHWRALMSPTEYWTWNYALFAVLRHRKTGKLVRFGTLHPPAHVQAPRHPTWPKVWKVLHEFTDKLRRLVRRNRGRVVADIHGLDLNVAVDQGWRPAGGWGFIEEGPLELVQAPEGTHGRRKIDVFLVRGAEAAPSHTRSRP